MKIKLKKGAVLPNNWKSCGCTSDDWSDLNEKVALITGGGQGLGLGIVLKMAEQGADIAIADLSDENLRQAADQVEGMGRKVYTVKMDVTDKGSVTAGVNDLTSQAGQIDILVNNAGIINDKLLLLSLIHI